MLVVRVRDDQEVLQKMDGLCSTAREAFLKYGWGLDRMNGIRWTPEVLTKYLTNMQREHFNALVYPPSSSSLG